MSKTSGDIAQMVRALPANLRDIAIHCRGMSMTSEAVVRSSIKEMTGRERAFTAGFALGFVSACEKVDDDAAP